MLCVIDAADIAFGKACGMQTLLPFTGVTSRAMLQDGAVQPDFVVDSFGL
eukprot:COSAG05_NODE_7122_length_853_cov_3.444297_1_plen_49_part_01